VLRLGRYGQQKQKYDQAAYQVQLDEKSLALLTLRAPAGRRGGPAEITGSRRRANAFQVRRPGRGRVRDWLELPDATALKISARIEEAERGQLSGDKQPSCCLTPCRIEVLKGK